MDFKEHRFRPGDTIGAVIKLFNKHDMPQAQLLKMIDEYNTLNNFEVPKVGTVHKIPVMK